MVQLLAQVVFLHTVQTLKVFQENIRIQTTIRRHVLLKATAATTIETSTTREAFGTWRWWPVVSVYLIFSQESNRKW